MEDVVPRGSVKKRCALWGRLIMVCLLGIALIMRDAEQANHNKPTP